MLQRPQDVPAPGDHVEFDDTALSPPLFSAMMQLGMISGYLLSFHKEAPFITQSGWSSGTFNQLFNAHNYVGLASLFATSNFASFNMVQMGFNMYFIWLFGSHVEGKIGSNRYLTILLGGMTIPWLLVLWELASQPHLVVFGPLFLICAIIGAYVVIPPKPLKGYGKGNAVVKNKIFREEERKDPRAKYIQNPANFITVFIAVQIFLHFWCTTGVPNPMETGKFLLQPFGTQFETLRLLPALLAVAIGYLVAKGAVDSASQALNEGPLAVQALRRYRELLELDVKHEEALKGTARTLGLSYDKTKELVRKNKGKMRIK
jgi:membrane associated rhomboid family serine protease